MPPPADLEEFSERTFSIWRKVRREVISAGVVSSLGVGIQFDKFPIGFHLITEIVASIAALAGVLSVYLSIGPRHPSDDREHLLNFYPLFSGLRVVVALGASIASYWLFYRNAKMGDETALLFLGLANFLLFRGVARSLGIIDTQERQRRLWDSIGAVGQAKWIEQRDGRLALIDGMRDLGDRMNRLREHSEQDLRMARRENLVRSIRQKLRDAWVATRPTRRRLGMITKAEVDAERRAHEEFAARVCGEEKEKPP